MTDSVRMFVNGEAMSGGRLHVNLRAATFCGPCSTAPRYRFFSVRDEFPGLHPVPEGGASIPGELYEVSYETLRESLLPAEPPNSNWASSSWRTDPGRCPCGCAPPR